VETANERLKNLLLLLLEALGADGELERFDRRRFKEYVAAAGYNPAEFDLLFDWFESQERPYATTNWLEVPLDNTAVGSGPRLFGDEERVFLSPHAFGHLLNLVADGQIDRRQMESVIQYASLFSSGPLSPRDIDQLLDQVVLTFNDQGTGHLPDQGLDSIH